nr:MAG TPA: hypothetical protein [Caudoviricetes sp.]
MVPGRKGNDCFASIFLKQLGLVTFCWTRH